MFSGAAAGEEAAVPVAAPADITALNAPSSAENIQSSFESWGEQEAEINRQFEEILGAPGGSSISVPGNLMGNLLSRLPRYGMSFFRQPLSTYAPIESMPVGEGYVLGPDDELNITLALSLGYGTDRMNGPFGGISWDAASWLTLKAEYSPMDYTLDQAGSYKPHPGAAKEKYNVGAVVNAPWGTELSMSWQRGEEFAFSLAQRFDLKSAFLFGRGRNTAYGAPGSRRLAQWRDVDPRELSGAIMLADAAGTKVVYERPSEKEKQGYSKSTRAVLDASKLRGLGWKPAFDMRKGLQSTLAILQQL